MQTLQKKTILFWVLVFSSYAVSGATIYTNDFGTQEQRDEWASRGLFSFEDDSQLDTNFDNKGAVVNYVWSNGGKYTMIVRIDAPDGLAFKNPVAGGQGYGSFSNWNTWTALSLSADGEVWDVFSEIPTSIDGWYDMEANSSNDPNYSNLQTIYLKISMFAGNGYYLPKAKFIAVCAELVELDRTIYSNDFGTQEQFEEFFWITPTGSDSLALENPGPNPPGDSDGDGLYRAVKKDAGFGSTVGTKVICAPVFKTLSNVVVSGFGKGNWANWATRAYWGISDDGETYDYSSFTDNSNEWKSYSVSSSDDPNYTNLNRLWVRTGVDSLSGVYNDSFSGRSAAFKVEADINDGQPGDKVLIYNNDFGVQEQRDELFSDGSFIYEMSSALDTDGDGLGAKVNYGWTGGGENAIIVTINAPKGKVFKNPIAMARGYGSFSNWDTWTELSLSVDGEVWDVVSEIPTSIDGWYEMVADSSAVTDYSYLETVYLKLRLHASNNGYLPRVEGLSVVAELVVPKSSKFIYSNDFGTQEQFEEFSWITPIGSDSLVLENPGPNPPGDSDLDGLYCAVKKDASYGRSVGTKVIYAPVFKTLSDITVSGFGKGDWANWASRASWGLSDDGEIYDYSITSDDSNQWKAYELSTNDDPNYTNLHCFWVRTGVDSLSGVYNDSFSGRSATFKVEADINDGLDGDKVLIYNNDFGTQEQQEEWEVAGTVSYENHSVLDTDFDGQGAQVNYVWSGGGSTTMVVRIDAPEGLAFKNPVATAQGFGSSFNWGTWTDIYLSANGQDWDVIGSHTSNDGWYDLVASSVGNINYGYLKAVYLKIVLNAANNGFLPKIKNLLVSADLIVAPSLDGSKIGLWAGNYKYDYDYHIRTVGLSDSSFSSVTERQKFWDEVHNARYFFGSPYFLELLFSETTTLDAMKGKIDRVLSSENGVETYHSDIIGICFDEEETPWPQAGILITDSVHNQLYDYVKSKYPVIQVYRWYSYGIKPLGLYQNVVEKCDGYVWDNYYSQNYAEYRKSIMPYLVTGKPLINIVWASEPTTSYFQTDYDSNKAPSEQDLLICNSPESALEKYWHGAAKVHREFGLPISMFGVANGGSVNSWYGGMFSPNLEYIHSELVNPTRKLISQSAGDPIYDFANKNTSSGMHIDVSGSYTYIDDYKTNGYDIGLGTLQEASIYGFLNMVQAGDPEGAVVTRGNGAGQVELVYRFYVSSGYIHSVSASLTGLVDTKQGGVNTLALSKTQGGEWTHFVSSTPGNDNLETLILDGGTVYDGCIQFYVHILMEYDSSLSGLPANKIVDLQVDCMRNL